MSIKSINYTFALIFILYSLIFIQFPNIDIRITTFLSNPNPTCDFITKKIRLWFIYFTILLTAINGLRALIGYLKRKSNYKHYFQNFIFLLFNKSIIAGLMVDILKHVFHRPRPYTMDILGGQETYVKLFHFSNICIKNCSFPSGDVAASALLFPVLYVLTKKIKLSFIFGLIFVCIVGYCRIAQNKHFFSDVLFSFFLVYYFSLISLMLIYKVKK
jgi:lipid A 4'-phosphatase